MGEVIDLEEVRRDRQRQQDAEKRTGKKRERAQGARSPDPCQPVRPSDRGDLIEDDPA